MAFNERYAGRKNALDEKNINIILQRYRSGETVSSLSKEFGISRQTIYSYISKNTDDKIYHSYSLWAKLNREFKLLNADRYTLRIEYMSGDRCLSVILVDFESERVEVVNSVKDPLLKPFGIKVKPNWEDFEDFMVERCIPAERYMIKQVLRDIKVDNYDCLSILERTEGRTGEDDIWLRFSHLCKERGFDGNIQCE